MGDRAVLFIDGNNWYHFMMSAGVTDPLQLSYVKISEKLIGPRDWVGTRYYIGALKQDWNPTDYANQRMFLDKIKQEDPRISIHLGRLEERRLKNPLANELAGLLAEGKIPAPLRASIRQLVAKYGSVKTLVEKAVDVHLAIDMVEMALADEYDCAYLLSADGDMTPAVQSVIRHGKKVYIASPGFSSQLEQVSNTFIRLRKEWFLDCYD